MQHLSRGENVKHRMRSTLFLYLALPLILGPAVAYLSGYFLHSLVPGDWYSDGFPVGWKKLEATGIPPDPPVFAFFSIGGFVLDTLFWAGLVLAILAAFTSLMFRKTTTYPKHDEDQGKKEIVH